MHDNIKNQIRFLLFFCSIAIVSGLFSIYDLLKIPKVTQNAWVFGYSKTRLITVFFMGLLVVGFILIVWRVISQPKWGRLSVQWVKLYIVQSWVSYLLIVGIPIVSILILHFNWQLSRYPGKFILYRRAAPVFLWLFTLYILSLVLVMYFQNKEFDFSVSHSVSKNTFLHNKLKFLSKGLPVFKIKGNLSIGMWVVLSFLLVYFLFFIQPVFLNNAQVMQFPRYINAATLVGGDLKETISFSKSVLIDKVYVKSFPPLSLILFYPLFEIDFPTTYRIFTIITLLCYCLSTLIIPILMSKTRESYSIVLFIFSIGLLSYGLQFELERGQFNLIAYTLSLVSIFIFHYAYKYRYFAYLLFSIAIHLKLWPAIFILMFIRDWGDWKNNIKRVLGLGIFNFLLLFVLGIEFFKKYIVFLSMFSATARSSHLNLSISSYVNGVIASIPLFKPYSSSIELSFMIIVFVFIVLIIYFTKKENQGGINHYLLFACTIGALVIPSRSNDYKLSIVASSIAIILSRISINNFRQRKTFFIFLIFMMSFVYSTTLFSHKYKPPILKFDFPALFILISTITALVLLKNKYTYSRLGISKD